MAAVSMWRTPACKAQRAALKTSGPRARNVPRPTAGCLTPLLRRTYSLVMPMWLAIVKAALKTLAATAAIIRQGCVNMNQTSREPTTASCIRLKKFIEAAIVLSTQLRAVAMDHHRYRAQHPGPAAYVCLYALESPESQIHEYRESPRLTVSIRLPEATSRLLRLQCYPRLLTRLVLYFTPMIA